MSKPIVAWDVESHLIKRGMGAPRLVCVSVADAEGPELFDREQGLDIVEELLQIRSVGHHIFYDLGVVAAEDSRRFLPKIFDALDAGRIECTLIRQKMIDNALGKLKYEWDEEKEVWRKQNYSLQRLIYIHGAGKHRAKGEDTWRLRYNELDGIPIKNWPQEASHYAMEDAVDALTIRNEQQRMVEPEGIPHEHTEMQSAWGLHLMSLWGVRTDPVEVAKLRVKLEVDFVTQSDICKKHGFMRKSGTKNLKKIREVVEAWYKTSDKDMLLTPKGQTATSRAQLVATDHDGLKAVAEAVRVQKLLTTYVPALERGTVVPINPSYNPILETYRTSCSGGMKIDKIPVGINVQNLPRGGAVRECFVARPGYVFIFCDYDTLEMRTLAQVCIDLFGYSDIRDAIKADRDLHVDLASEMLDIPYEQAWALHVAGDPTMKKDRQGCKIGNYGFAGGMGWRTFIEYAKGFGVTITPERAQKLWKNFRRKWREMVEYFAYCSFLCKEGNHGRAEQIEFVRSGMMRGDVSYTATCNGFFQHLAAKGAKEAVYRVSKECYIGTDSALYGSRPWLFAHDEIGMETPIAAIGPRGAHEAALRLEYVMNKAMEHWCPDVPIGSSAAMTRRWYKGAEPVFVDGILVPSKPVIQGVDKKGKPKTVWVADV